MPEDPINSKEVAAALRDLQQQLKDLSRIVSSAENERNLMHRVWMLEQELSKIAHTESKAAERNWQIRVAMFVAVLGLTSSVLSPLLGRLFAPAAPAPSPTPSLPFDEPRFPPGEGEPG